MLMVFMPEGIQVNGVLLRSDTAAGNLNFYKGIEGFLESFPQAIYQISILFRSAGKTGMKYDWNTFQSWSILIKMEGWSQNVSTFLEIPIFELKKDIVYV